MSAFGPSRGDDSRLAGMMFTSLCLASLMKTLFDANHEVWIKLSQLISDVSSGHGIQGSNEGYLRPVSDVTRVESAASLRCGVQGVVG